MKQILLAMTAMSILSGSNVYAGDGHSHKEKNKPASHSHKKGEMCDKCKKGEKECSCDDHSKHGENDKHDDHDDKNDQKDSK